MCTHRSFLYQLLQFDIVVARFGHRSVFITLDKATEFKMKLLHGVLFFTFCECFEQLTCRPNIKKMTIELPISTYYSLNAFPIERQFVLRLNKQNQAAVAKDSV